MIALALLIVINLLILKMTQEPQVLVEVKQRYKKLRDHLNETKNEKYAMLKTPVPLTGMRRMKESVGYNTNKGGEIVVCLDGNANDVFHVLIHELAHCTVKEYSHSDKFWKNYIELRDMCVELGIYEQIPDRKEFCGQHIQDK
jgi:predicted metal-dependent hydrolase